MLEFDTPNQQRLYIGVPDDQVQALLEFRAAHPYQSFTHNGIEWQYIDTGVPAGVTAGETAGAQAEAQAGKSVLLVFPGSIGLAEASWQTIRRFESHCRVVCPSYPPLRGMADVAHGAAALLEHLGIARANVMGASYGGFAAQVFVRLYPQVVQKLVVAQAGPPELERGQQIARVMRWLRLLPFSMIQSVFQKRMTGMLPSGHPTAAFTNAFYNDMIFNRLTKKGIVATYDRSVDYDTAFHFEPSDLAGWTGAVQLLLSNDDPATPPDTRREMERLYPGASVVDFTGTGHAPALLQPEAFYGAIESFLQCEG